MTVVAAMPFLCHGGCMDAMEGNRHHHGHHGHAEAGHRHEPHASRPARVRHRLAHLVRPHSHESVDKVDTAMETSREGMRTLWLSLAVLGATTVIQAVIVALSGRSPCSATRSTTPPTH